MSAPAQHMAFLLQLPRPHNGRFHTLLHIPTAKAWGSIGASGARRRKIPLYNRWRFHCSYPSHITEDAIRLCPPPACRCTQKSHLGIQEADLLAGSCSNTVIMYRDVKILGQYLPYIKTSNLLHKPSPVVTILLLNSLYDPLHHLLSKLPLYSSVRTRLLRQTLSPVDFSHAPTRSSTLRGEDCQHLTLF